MDMQLILAIALGALFGFALNRAGATNPGLIIKMLRLSNLHLMKVILFAIGLSTVALFSGLALGLLMPRTFRLRQPISASLPAAHCSGSVLPSPDIVPARGWRRWPRGARTHSSL